jgi:hypothetical protein
MVASGAAEARHRGLVHESADHRDLQQQPMSRVRGTGRSARGWVNSEDDRGHHAEDRPPPALHEVGDGSPPAGEGRQVGAEAAEQVSNCGITKIMMIAVIRWPRR